MEQYCITLRQAKRLRELGFDRGSDYFWQEEIAYPENGEILIEDKEIPIGIDAPAFNIYQAYHVGELGEFLEYWLGEIRYEGEWIVDHWTERRGEFKAKYPTEAQARGALLIYLLESKLI